MRNHAQLIAPAMRAPGCPGMVRSFFTIYFKGARSAARADGVTFPRTRNQPGT